eukprot:3661638-Alexandrium_andersonii.AAC.1
MRPAMLLLKQHDVRPRMLADDVFGSTFGPTTWARLRTGANAMYAYFTSIGARVAPDKSRLFANTPALRRVMTCHTWASLDSRIPVVGHG